MKLLLTVFASAFMLYVPWVLAQTSQTETAQTSFDCTHLSIEEVDDSLLTKAERLALMDKNLQTSMDKYDQCMSAAQQQMAGGGSGGAGQGGGNSANAGQSGDGSQAEGQQTTATTNTASSQQQTSSSQSALSSVTASQGSNMTNRPRQLAEPKDNDSIICKLLWQEIQSAGPDKIEGFTKQYDDYKCG